MSRLLYVFPCAALLLEGLLLWRLFRRELASRYPLLTVFVLYRFLGDAILFPIHRFRPDWFPAAYWRLETITLFLQFAINSEFFRGVFPQRAPLYNIASKMLKAVALVAVPAFVALGWNQASSVHFVYLHLSPLVEQYFCLAQAILLLAPTCAALYYRVPLGRNLRGLCIGFGIYLLLRSVDFAGLQIFRGFAPWWRLLTPATFIGMIAVWVWAFWEYAPSPVRLGLSENQQWKSEWQYLWNRTIALLRRGA